MSVCTFFGHSECYGLDAAVLRSAIEELIEQGITEFVVGNHGQFDGMVFSCLQSLSKDYPKISYSVALAYLPPHNQEYDIYAYDTIGRSISLAILLTVGYHRTTGLDIFREVNFQFLHTKGKGPFLRKLAQNIQFFQEGVSCSCMLRCRTDKISA